MKKLLSILSVISLQTATVSTVVACRKTPKIDNVEDEKPGEEELDDTAEKLTLRNEFLTEANNLIRDYIDGVKSESLMNTIEAALIANSFIKDEILNQLLGDKETVKVDLTNEQKNLINRDIETSLKLASSLKPLLENFKEVEKYSFLFNGINSIYKSFSIVDDLEITKSISEDEKESNYLVSFKIEVALNYSFNNVTEDHLYLSGNLNYNLVSSDSIFNALKELALKLPKLIYEENKDFFDLDSDILDTNNQAFSAKNDDALYHFSKADNKKKLDDIVNLQAKDIIGGGDVNAITFVANSSKVLDRLYGEQNIAATLSEKSFVEQAIMLKDHENITDQSKIEAFETDYSSNFDKDQFRSNAKTIISNNFGVELIDEQNKQFIEYGSFELSDIVVSAFGMEISLNSFNLLYTYNTEKVFSQEVVKALENLQKLWGIEETSERYAALKIKENEENSITKDIWDSFKAYPTKPFEKINKDVAKYYSPALQGTAISSMIIDNDNGKKNPYAEVWDEGFAIFYSGYGEDQMGRNGGWKLVTKFDDITFTIEAWNIEGYKDFFRGIRGQNTFIIERK
ncbi:hypothetical protein SCHIN_v1c01890 [Spiroplasma chinense]|uniref:Lipoprotein n=1 Tax=Spiroplasma chinense TaxID=216932 RepID=A0A5B9Y565_9MOLU|nr:lipoprotein [Spiroplasma chinense]QEH61387.1 hypothetical protein SCHIN_v1c01890 [Spiroplasma chinense]